MFSRYKVFVANENYYYCKSYFQIDSRNSENGKRMPCNINLKVRVITNGITAHCRTYIY